MDGGPQGQAEEIIGDALASPLEIDVNHEHRALAAVLDWREMDWSENTQGD